MGLDISGLVRNFATGTGGNRNSVAVGDFNGDGNQDLAVTNETFNTSTVSILLGDGTGNFSPATIVWVSPASFFLAGR